MYAIYEGDAMAGLKALPPQSAHVCVTSPPYWGQRTYGSKPEPYAIGNEESYYGYLERLLGVFEEVRRVLRNDGVFWLNVGDIWGKGSSDDRFGKGRLVGLPFDLGCILGDCGWYLRQTVIWHKTNPQRESRYTARPHRSHEYIFMFTKGMEYAYDIVASRGNDSSFPGSVWSFATARNPAKHFATFPPELVRRCLSGYPRSVCGICGLPAVARYDVERVPTRPGRTSKAAGLDGAATGSRDPLRHVSLYRNHHLKLTCKCPETPAKPIVLDPFAGIGTTGWACESDFDFIGCEIVPEYVSKAAQLLSENGHEQGFTTTPSPSRGASAFGKLVEGFFLPLCRRPSAPSPDPASC